MRRLLATGALLAPLLLVLAVSDAQAHGTFYKPPPPAEPPPAVQPAGPPPAAPGPVIPENPGKGNSPGASAPPAPANGGQPDPTTPTTMDSVDLSHWSFWWTFNKDELLRYRERLLEGYVASGGTPGGGGALFQPSPGVLEQTVVEALFLAVAEAKYDGVVSAALIGLGRSSSTQRARIAETLDGLLGSRDPQVREAALLARGLLGELDGVQLLVRVLTEDRELVKEVGRKFDHRMRAFAGFGLALLAEESPIPEVGRMAALHLVEVLADTREHRDLRTALAVALGSLQIPWAGPGEVRDPATLRTREDLIERILMLQEDEDTDLVRAHLLVALGELFSDGGGPDALRLEVAEVLIEELDARQAPDVRNGMLMALGHMGTAWGSKADARIRAVLEIASRNDRGGETNDFSRHLALMAFAEASSRSPGGTPPPAEVRATFEDAVVERLEGARSVETTWLCLAAASYGARISHQGGELSPALVTALEGVLTHGGSSDRLATASLALGLGGSERSAEVILDVLGSTGNASVRGYCALALGLLRHEEAIDELEELLYANRYQREALESTAMGLALLNRTKAFDRLSELLSGARSQALASGIAVTVGRVADPKAASYLAGYVRSGDTGAALRSFTTVALGMLGDPRMLPWRRYLSAGVNYAAYSPSLLDTSGMGVLNIL